MSEQNAPYVVGRITPIGPQAQPVFVKPAPNSAYVSALEHVALIAAAIHVAIQHGVEQCIIVPSNGWSGVATVA